MQAKITLPAALRQRLPAWQQSWEARSCATGDASRGPPASGTAIQDLYTMAGQSGRPRVVRVASPFQALLVGGIAAAILAVLRHPDHVAHRHVTQWVRQRAALGEQAEDAAAGFEALVWAAIGPPNAIPVQHDPASGLTSPAHWSVEDRLIWHATSGETRIAITSAPPGQLKRGIRDQLGAQLNELSERTASPRLTSVRTAVERALHAAAWETPGQTTCRQSYRTAVAPAHAVAARVFGPDNSIALRCIRLASRMLDLGRLEAERYTSLSFLRHVARLPVDWRWWDLFEASILADGGCVLHPAFCIIADPPNVLSFDVEGRPHAGEGPFCAWRDGSGLFAVNGIAVPARWMLTPARLSVAEIEKQRDPDLRRVMIDRFEPDRFLRAAGASILDHESGVGTLFHKPLPGDEPLVMVEVINRTREPDGHFRHYWLRVPPDTRTARAAVAWTFGVTPEEYRPLEES